VSASTATTLTMNGYRSDSDRNAIMFHDVGDQQKRST
jgi:hypothetical protein